MQQQPASNPISEPSFFKSYPKCLNKKEARMTCLNEGCNDYAFFCLQCEDQSCERVHRHQNKADKYIAISFKEYIRRVLKEKKPIEQLEGAVSTYRETLQRLRKDINQFVEKELKSLQQIIQKTNQVPQDLYPTIKKLKQQQYDGLTGKQMDHLWRNCGQSQESIRIQQETSQFIKIKEEELKAISQHFQNLNKMEIDKIQENIGTNSKNNSYGGQSGPRGGPSPMSNNPGTNRNGSNR